MKKLALLLIPLLLVIFMIACDNQSNVSNTKDNDEKSKQESSEIESKEDSSDNNISYVESDSTNSDVSSDDSETITRTITGITVQLNGKDKLNQNGYTVSGSSITVDIKIEGPKNTVESLTADDFSATIDVSTIAEDGNIEMMIYYTVPSGINVIEKQDFANITIKKKSAEITPPVNNDAYMSNGIIVSGNRGMENFGGSSAAGAKTAEKLNQFKVAVGANVNVYMMPCPSASAFYAPSKYPNSIQNHVNMFNGIRDNLVDVKLVDTLSALSSHTDEYIYFRTDFHWTGLGAYYAAEELANVAGTPFDNISTYTENVVTKCFSGGLARYASVLKNDPDDVYWYVPAREHTVTYYSQETCTNPITGRTLFSGNKGYTKFIYGDSYTTHIQSNVGNGRKLLIFKDSYGNALAPYVLSSFDEVYIADYRYFKLNAKEFINEKGITDVCFAMSAFAANGSKRDYITKLLNY